MVIWLANSTKAALIVIEQDTSPISMHRSNKVSADLLTGRPGRGASCTLPDENSFRSHARRVFLAGESLLNLFLKSCFI